MGQYIIGLLDKGGWRCWPPLTIGRITSVETLDLVMDVMRTPFGGIGKPELLKYMDSDTSSRRIDLEHRLVYRVRGDRVDVLACRYHY
jgi:toxin YoeB